MLSVLIPTLNEATRLPRLLQDLTALTVDHEIIIADGGSTDGTAELALARGYRLIHAAPGRGRQLRAGAAAARGDWLLVLHADARLSPDALADAEQAIRRGEPQAAAWPLAIDDPARWARLVEHGAEWRWRVLGLPYGDQGLLVRRSLYEAVGGFPDVRIMEDVALVRRLRRRARVHRLGHAIKADPRRWTREGAVRGTVRNLSLLLLFLAGVAPDRLARWYRPSTPGR